MKNPFDRSEGFSGKKNPGKKGSDDLSPMPV